VRYGGTDGPDLAAVAAATGLSIDDVIERHSGVTYEVLILGFAPGFAYLGDLDPAIRVPRLATPRPRVPAGSVAIADGLAGIYPAALPGGWRIVGRTDVSVFDPRAAEPALLSPGDRVRFEPLR
jgi:KipI family sensor histidine kinase inhibitor